jgi:hypothetical protein
MPLNRFTLLPSTETVAVGSSAITDLAYDRQQEILAVRFRDSSVYQYSAVPLRVYQDFLRADSKGTYFNLNIRNHFPQRNVARPSSFRLG